MADVADCLPEIIDSPRRYGAKLGLELCEGHFDGIEIGAVGWKEEEPGAPGPHEPLGLFALVARKVVEDDDVTFFEDGGKLGLDVALEDDPVHRPVDDPGSNEAVAFEASDEGLGAPVAEGCRRMEPVTLDCPPPEPRHLGGGRGLVQEDQAALTLAHIRLAKVFPLGPSPGQFRPVLLGGAQGFF